MARRRMISSKITDTDSFAAMSLRAKFLYYELLLKADDDGFLGSPIRIIKMAGCKKLDLDELIKNGYIIEFTTGVIVVRDWKIHNNIRKDMYEETIYQNEFSMLQVYKNRYYLKTECNVTEDVTGDATEYVTEDVTENVTQNVTENVTQDRLGKDSIDKDSVKENRARFTPPTLEDVKAYCMEKGYDIDPEHFIDFYEAKGWMIGKNKMKDWKAAVRTWVKRDNKSTRQQSSESEPICYDLPPEYQEMYDKYLSKTPRPDDPFQ